MEQHGGEGLAQAQNGAPIEAQVLEAPFFEDELAQGGEREGLESERAQVIWDAVYRGLEPAEVWRHFAHLNAIPRPSGHEEQARAYVCRVARDAGASFRVDGAGNVVVYKEASGGSASGGAGSNPNRSVALQSHLDMVCERVPDRTISWTSDPILPRREGGRISAKGTTLGADNGIGAAMMLALLSGSGLPHPPLELLFTVEEETGLQGASGLDGSLLSAQWLLNLDTEEPDEIVIGCAGGRGANIDLPIERAARDGEWMTLALEVGGLAGGHSGIEIGQPLGNAISILAQSLRTLEEKGPEFRLIEAHGGNARNAIPRDAAATLVIDGADRARLLELVASLQSELQAQWQAHEPRLFMRAQPIESAPAPLTRESSRAIVQLLLDSPHGVLLWSQRWAGKVETSCNLATLQTGDDQVQIHISGRSFREAALQEWQEQMQVLADSHGARCTLLEGYPGWEPAEDAAQNRPSLLEAATRAFERAGGSRPKIEIVHAGLECGLILSKRPNMEAISFGPLIRGAHTPEEWVDIASVNHSWRILLELLRTLSEA